MSVHKHKNAKGKSVWYVSVYLGMDPSGRQLRHLKRGFKRRVDAKAYELEIKEKVEKARSSESLAGLLLSLSGKSNLSVEVPERKTFADVYHSWLVAYKDSVQVTTYQRTLDLFRLHILPDFGRLPVAQISPSFCQEFIRKKSLTLKNIKQLKSYVGLVLDHALTLDLITKNPMSPVAIPKKRREPVDSSNYWDIQTLQSFLEILSYEPPLHRLLFRLLIFTGARKSEIYGLKVQDIDPEAGTLTIQRSVHRVGEDLLITPTKSKSSRRTIHLDTETLQSLTNWISSEGLGPDDWLMSKDEDRHGPLHADFANHILKRLIKNHYLPPLTVHGLRHTHATLLTDAGVDVESTAQRLGHGSVRITKDAYIHTANEDKKSTVETFAQLIDQNDTKG